MRSPAGRGAPARRPTRRGAPAGCRDQQRRAHRATEPPHARRAAAGPDGQPPRALPADARAGRGAARAASSVCRRRRRTRLARACAGRPRRPHVRPPRASRRPVGLRPGRSTVMPGAPISRHRDMSTRCDAWRSAALRQTVRGRPHRRVSVEKPVRPTKDHCASRQLCQESGSYAVRCPDSRREEGRTSALALIGPVGRVLDPGVLATMAALFRCCETVGRWAPWSQGLRER
jgi:hypothetical protein